MVESGSLSGKRGLEMGVDGEKGPIKSRGRLVMPEMVPPLLCVGCLEVAMKYSEAAKAAFQKVVECYGLPDLEQAFEAVADGIPSGPELVSKIVKASGFKGDGKSTLRYLVHGWIWRGCGCGAASFKCGLT
jgi:hypothetical protein